MAASALARFVYPDALCQALRPCSAMSWRWRRAASARSRPSHTDSGRRTRLGFLCGREAGRLVRHESRRQAMARVAGHLSVEDLEAGFRSARDPTAARHFQVIWLLARGHTIADVAAVTSFVPRWIEQLLARYNAHGPERPWATCAGAMEACRACCALSFWSGCARGSRRLRPMGPVVQPQSGGLDGGRTRPRCGLAPTWLGGPEGDRLVGAEAAPAPPRLGHARGAGGVQKSWR